MSGQIYKGVYECPVCHSHDIDCQRTLYPYPGGLFKCNVCGRVWSEG